MAIDLLIQGIAKGVKTKSDFDKRRAAEAESGLSQPPIPVRTTPTPPASPPVVAKPMTNQEKVNRAADVLHVPGRDVVRGALSRRRAMLEGL